MNPAVIKFSTASSQQTQPGIFNQQSFIENVGQYGTTYAGQPQLGNILFGYEGMGMPVLFTTNGIVYLQRKVKWSKKEKEQANEREGEKEKQIQVKDGAITLQWLHANPHPQIIAEGVLPVYHTYGLLPQKARAYEKITLKDLYPGIDVLYSFNNNQQQHGFEYSIVVHPGANISKLQVQYGGDVAALHKDNKGNLQLRSRLGIVHESAPLCYYAEDSLSTKNNSVTTSVKAQLQIQNKIGQFKISTGYDTSKTLIIDPFITTLNGYTGPNANLAYNIDFDYDGNIYVQGAGDEFTPCELAKYDKSGNLLWVFHGTLTTPAWLFGQEQGGWVVEKSTGKILIGQGATLDFSGVRIIRLSNTGFYDNFITTADPNLDEDWKMLWLCNNGNPKIFIAGGGISSNLNFSVCAPPTTTLSSLNITGIPIAGGQDIADFIVDPETNSMYTIFCTNTPSANFINNRIYKHDPSYTSSSILWSTLSGYTTLVETGNRPFSNTPGVTAQTCLAVNHSYLFYWDGKNLKAFNKATGAAVGTPLTVAGNTALMQQGIVADACDNVYVGDKNGLIKVYHFTGNVFDDAAAADIPIPGFTTSTTYAMAYDIGKKLLYACGQGYVASFDISGYCTSQIYSINTTADCLTGQATAQIQPAPPAGSTVTYNLYNGSTFISSNTTGIFNGLTSNITYTVKAVINIACSGAQTEKDFVLVAPAIGTTNTTPATCTQNIGTITVTVATGTAPYSYSVDGGAYQNSSTLTGLTVGNHTVTLKDNSGCTDTKTVNVLLSGANTVTVTAGADATICEGSSVQLSATSNATSFAWTPTTGLSNATILNPVASPTVTTQYTITATSAPCSNTASLTIFVNAAPIANAGANASICFGKSTQLSGSGGQEYSWQPTTYLDNAGIANPNVIQPQQSITYSLKTTDANGCTSLNTSAVTITVRPPEKVFAGNDTSIAINQPLQLSALDINQTGFAKYSWQPAYGLNNATIAAPVAMLDKDMTYYLTATTAENCVGKDTINIKVFNSPEIYVPNAFSPNSDGVNDLLHVIPIGLKEFKYFVIYNRYGEKIFYTTNPAKGWDGTWNGKPQNAGGFAWMAEGVDYKGNVLVRKGTVLVVR